MSAATHRLVETSSTQLGITPPQPSGPISVYLGLGEGLGLGVPDGMGLAEGLGEADTDGLGDGDGEGLGEADGADDGVGDPVGEATGELDGLADGEELATAAGDGLGDGLAASSAKAAPAQPSWLANITLRNNPEINRCRFIGNCLSPVKHYLTDTSGGSPP